MMGKFSAFGVQETSPRLFSIQEKEPLCGNVSEKTACEEQSEEKTNTFAPAYEHVQVGLRSFSSSHVNHSTGCLNFDDNKPVNP